MKKIFLIALMLILIAALAGSGFKSFQKPARAQDNEDCDPDQLTAWLDNWQRWMNATDQVVKSKTLGTDAVDIGMDNLLALSAAERPSCADDAMRATAFWYAAVFVMFDCIRDDRSTCFVGLSDLPPIYQDEMIMAILELTPLVNFEISTTALPEGWKLK